jgi:hypothetical protein
VRFLLARLATLPTAVLWRAVAAANAERDAAVERACREALCRRAADERALRAERRYWQALTERDEARAERDAWMESRYLEPSQEEGEK